MSTENVFAERFNNSPIHGKLDQALSAIEQELSFRSEAVRPLLKRILKGLQFAKTKLALVDGYLTGTDGIQRIDKALSNILAAIEQFRGENAGQHVNKASAELDNNLLPALSSLPTIASGSEAAEALGGIVVRFEEDLRLREAALNQRLEKIAREIEAKQSELARLEQLIAEQGDRLTQQNARVDSAVSDLQGRFLSTEAEQATRFAEQLNKFSSRVDEKTGELTNALDKIVSGANVQATEQYKAIAKLKDDAERTVSAIGGIATAGSYRQTATEDNKAANRMRWGAIFLLALMIGAVGWLIFNDTGEITLKSAVFRLTITLVIALAAGYFAVESSRHREAARRMRRIELELTSLDAFIAGIPEQERGKIRAELTRKYFGNIAPEQPVEGMSYKEIIAELTGIIRAFKKPE